MKYFDTQLHDTLGRRIHDLDCVVVPNGMTGKYIEGYVFYAKGSFRVQYIDGDEDYLEEVHDKLKITGDKFII